MKESLKQFSSTCICIIFVYELEIYLFIKFCIKKMIKNETERVAGHCHGQNKIKDELVVKNEWVAGGWEKGVEGWCTKSPAVHYVDEILKQKWKQKKMRKKKYDSL